MIPSLAPQGIITKELIKTVIPLHPVIIEAGAHKGRDTIKMAKMWPSGTIYSFEPVPELFNHLTQVTASYPHVTCFNLALSNEETEATLYVSSGASTAASSLLEPYTYRQERPEVSFNPLTIKTTTLDKWAALYNIEKADFLWLDMQGGELNALKGGHHLIPGVSALVIEVNITERFKGAPSYDEVFAWAHKYGFKALVQDAPKHNKVNILFVAQDRV